MDDEKGQQAKPLLAEHVGFPQRHQQSSAENYLPINRTSTAAVRVDHLLTPEDIKSASPVNSWSPALSPYPPSIHGVLLSAPENRSRALYPPVLREDLEILPLGMYGSNQPGYNSSGDVRLDEVEIRQLLIDHIGHRCCWGSHPARRWKITSTEDCNVYVGTLESFIEERESIKQKVPFKADKIDEKSKPELGLWELDLRSEFPPLFVADKKIRFRVPNSESIERCADCDGHGDIACPTCNLGKSRASCQKNQMTQCACCHGRGLIAHRDGSDTLCKICGGKGILPCKTCGSRGLVPCNACEGCGSFLIYHDALITWRTLLTRKVSTASGAASVPEEVLHRTEGVLLCNYQAYQCMPTYFADSCLLNQFSAAVIASRHPIPSSAQVISERHVITVVPVTRITMAHRKRSFSFYVIGYDRREVFIRDYPSKLCWGLWCCCQ